MYARFHQIVEQCVNHLVASNAGFSGKRRRHYREIEMRSLRLCRRADALQVRNRPSMTGVGGGIVAQVDQRRLQGLQALQDLIANGSHGYRGNVRLNGLTDTFA